jgi:spectinomycin phosphotransferase
LNNILLRRGAEILYTLEHLRIFQVYAQLSNPKTVVCHTDIHGGNLMVGHDGNLYMLDWENAIIAPPEHDLMFFAGEPGFLETFYPIYSRKIGTHHIDLKLLEYCFYRRALEDLADFILRVNSGSGTPKQDREDIQESLDILNNLPEIKKTIKKLRKEFD